MSEEIMLQEGGFTLSFYTVNDFSQFKGQFPARLIADGGYILQERIIVPPELADTAADFSAHNLVPSRCNQPLILVGHRDLPVQYTAIVARAVRNTAQICKNGQAIQVSAEGVNCLFSAPLYSRFERTEASMSGAFESMRGVLFENGMCEADIARTWLYMNDILADYEILNRAREGFFQESRLPGNHFFPASTGIEGQLIDARPLSIEFCAFSGNRMSIRRLASPLQNEPTAYGKLFSRAVAVQFPSNQLILISGTAAIDIEGVSLYYNDVKRQTEKTLEIIAAILQDAGGDFSHIAQAIVYIKRNCDLEACLEVLRKAEFPCHRALFQLDTSVCRDELLCEVEVTAII